MIKYLLFNHGYAAAKDYFYIVYLRIVTTTEVVPIVCLLNGLSGIFIPLKTASITGFNLPMAV
ncbi:hypothetical protein [Kosmotoga pacifica]|uniref:hypothetical protein n=1 Tax=Kosmotoga pacifica TaxID=1330330 RepID=UPI00146FEA2E|nr:hypothetical protein [Kosmotoga pacifica]